MTYLNNDLSQVCLLLPMLCWRIIQRVRNSRQEGKRAVEDDDSDGTNEEENEADESYEALPRQEWNSLRPFMTFHAWPFHFTFFFLIYIYLYPYMHCSLAECWVCQAGTLAVCDDSAWLIEDMFPAGGIHLLPDEAMMTRKSLLVAGTATNNHKHALAENVWEAGSNSVVDADIRARKTVGILTCAGLLRETWNRKPTAKPQRQRAHRFEVGFCLAISFEHLPECLLRKMSKSASLIGQMICPSEVLPDNFFRKYHAETVVCTYEDMNCTLHGVTSPTSQTELLVALWEEFHAGWGCVLGAFAPCPQCRDAWAAQKRFAGFGDWFLDRTGYWGEIFQFLEEKKHHWNLFFFWKMCCQEPAVQRLKEENIGEYILHNFCIM